MSAYPKQKWLIGLTGSILSGKSTALAYFKQAGAEVISCDQIVQELYTRADVLKKIKALLGTDQKAKIAEAVFKNAAKRNRLEKILHPLILKQARAQIKKSPRFLVVWEIPLLFETGWEKFVDLTVCVLADPNTLPQRLKGRNMKRAEYERRLKTQLPPTEKASKADIVFVHKNKIQLKQSVNRFCCAFNVLQKK